MISEPIRTGDGSLTCRHPGYNEPYHALQGAHSEALEKFIRPAGLADRLQRAPVRLLDVGFGLGVNCRAALDTARALPGSSLHIDSLENDPDAWTRATALYPDCLPTRALAATGHHSESGLTVLRHDGDIRRTLLTLPGPFDLVFHDPFSPLKNTECWTLDLFRLLHARLAPDSLLLTYSESAAVRAGLLQAGFHIGQTPVPPPHRPGTMAARNPALLPLPLNPADFAPFPKNIPFQDPNLRDSGQTIRARREALIRNHTRVDNPLQGDNPIFEGRT